MIERSLLNQLGGGAVVVLVLAGCGYSEAELNAAYRDGHRAGIIWCKRDEPLSEPDIASELLERWQDGWRESTRIQCPDKPAR